ncbi:sugar ABC transporter substrate-binding protein [Candidatus Woesearchaeota archaeon]|nr:sugar ABC transporter substrate-binding protein [Candidatus Woesearchaeota archaeon]
MKAISVLLAVFLVTSVFLVGCASQQAPTPAETIPAQEPSDAAPEKITLTYMVHWNWDAQLNGLKKYTDEYTALHPNVEFEIVTVNYGDYFEKIRQFHEADAVPDIYQVYSTWGVTYADEGILDTPPAGVAEDVKANYFSTAGVTINGKIWGYPTEINDFMLVYDKKMFRDAGIVDANGEAKAPETWDELIADAVKLTKKDDKGSIIQYGYAFQKSEDWGVVDPFLSLLWSNNGEFLSSDYSEALMNSPEGVEALTKIVELFEKGATDPNSNMFDLGKGTVAMAIAAPWLEGSFKENFGDRFETDIGVAPIPGLKKPATLQYSWFSGVTAKSRHKQEAWDFLKWLHTEVQPETGTTRYGDLLTNVIGAIPSRNVDLENHQEQLSSVFKKGYVAELKNSVPEPNILEAGRVKKALLDEIVGAWVGDKTPKEALDAAKAKIDPILAENYGN